MAIRRARRANRTVRRVATGTGVVVGTALGVGLAVGGGFFGYLVGQGGENLILSDPILRESFGSYAQEAARTVKYGLPVVTGGAGILMGFRTAPYVKEGVQDYLTRLLR